MQLKPEIERFIDEQVRAGRFPSREAVVEGALVRMMEEDVELSDDDLAAIEESDRQIERGECEDFAAFAARTRAKYGISK